MTLVISRSLDAGRVVRLTLNRDSKRNALSVDMCHAIEEALNAAVADGAGAILLTATGNVFSAGADLGEKDFAGELYPAIERLMTTLRRLPVVVVAYVEGPAIGAGAMLAMACDVRVVSKRASFRIPVTDMAIGVDEDTVRSLSGLVGSSRARAMLLLGTELDWKGALDSGFALTRGDLEDSDDDALAVARRAATKAPLTVKQLKMEFADSFSAAERDAARSAAWNSEDFAEVGQARAEKRAPEFKGR